MLRSVPFPGLAAVAADYDALLCDVWGVVHDGVTAHTGIAEALTRFQDFGPVVLITNAPRPSAPVVEQLAGMGLSREIFSAIVSSGDVVHQALAEAAPLAVYHLGHERDLPLYEGLDIRLTETADDADLVVAAGLRDDRTEHPEDYREELAAIARTGMRFICANPDIVVERGPLLLYCAGALAQIYEDEGGQAEQFGKPFPPIYQAALAKAREFGAARTPLVVGDGRPTDIAGAYAQGLDAVFITSGIHNEDLYDAGPPDVTRFLMEVGIGARYFARRLTWEPDEDFLIDVLDDEDDDED